MSADGRVSVERKQEIAGALILALSMCLFLALATDGYQGENRRSLSDLTEVPNTMGKAGAAVAGVLYIVFGQAAHVLYFMTLVWGLMLLCHRSIDRFGTRLIGFLLLLCAVAGLLHLDFGDPASGHYPGGVMGAFVASLIIPTFGYVGSNVIAVTAGIVGVLLATEFLFIRLAYGGLNALGLVVYSIGDLRFYLGRVLGELQTRQAARKESRAHRRQDARAEKRSARSGRKALKESEVEQGAGEADEDLSRIRIRHSVTLVEQELPFDSVPEDGREQQRAVLDEELRTPQFEETPAGEFQWVESEQGLDDTEAAQPAGLDDPFPAFTNKPASSSKKRKEPMLRRKGIMEELPPDYVYPKRYTKPSLEMLEEADRHYGRNHTESLQRTALLLEETLKTFGIESRVTDVTRGPTITRFELEPAPGIKVSRFMSLADDLALALKAHRVRVEAPIPGKARVGIEVPNEERDEVVIRDLLESPNFRRHKGALTLALGKDIAGEVTAADLALMPHLLVAGATGAGKTVCVKTVLASLLFTKTPDELQLMLIDPKMVELSIFNDIPHLITPVVIDPRKASTSLNWLINEMEERYRLFAHLRVRNIEVYNQSVENGEIEMEETGEGGGESLSVIRKLPYIVCIIDELADLMILARAEVEDAIARLAQLARAVGIHLIIATQRPSVDVLTGVIKANFPARISFQVSSRVDSRCILDEIGAERLIGRGDLLYLPAGQSKPLRVQGAFVSDDEMNALIAYLKTQAPPQYRDEIERWGEAAGGAR